VSLPEQPVRIVWHNAPPTPGQLAAWDRLWARLLDHSDPDPKTPKPQDHGYPGASNSATVASGRPIVNELINDTTNPSLNT
jgi:hypothetical protein